MTRSELPGSKRLRARARLVGYSLSTSPGASALAWGQRSSGLVPALSSSALQLLSVIPSGMRQRAVGLSLSAAPLARAIEVELVDEVSRCWAEIPLPRSLPEIIDEARRLQLTLLLEQRARQLWLWQG